MSDFTWTTVRDVRLERHEGTRSLGTYVFSVYVPRARERRTVSVTHSCIHGKEYVAYATDEAAEAAGWSAYSAIVGPTPLVDVLETQVLALLMAAGGGDA